MSSTRKEDSGYIVKVEVTGFVDGLPVDLEKGS